MGKMDFHMGSFYKLPGRAQIFRFCIIDVFNIKKLKTIAKAILLDFESKRLNLGFQPSVKNLTCPD